jgi:hypothetical protein
VDAYPFPYLVDEPEEGSIDSTGWLPLDAAATPDEAAVELRDRYEETGGYVEGWDEDGLTLRCAGTEWLIPTLEVYDGDDVGELRGADAVRVAGERGLDELRFDRCAPDTPGALEWWAVELVPGCPDCGEPGCPGEVDTSP